MCGEKQAYAAVSLLSPIVGMNSPCLTYTFSVLIFVRSYVVFSCYKRSQCRGKYLIFFFNFSKQEICDCIIVVSDYILANSFQTNLNCVGAIEMSKEFWEAAINRLPSCTYFCSYRSCVINFMHSTNVGLLSHEKTSMIEIYCLSVRLFLRRL
jgi:hypothetical protein